MTTKIYSAHQPKEGTAEHREWLERDQLRQAIADQFRAIQPQPQAVFSLPSEDGLCMLKFADAYDDPGITYVGVERNSKVFARINIPGLDVQKHMGNVQEFIRYQPYDGNLGAAWIDYVCPPLQNRLDECIGLVETYFHGHDQYALATSFTGFRYKESSVLPSWIDPTDNEAVADFIQEELTRRTRRPVSQTWREISVRKTRETMIFQVFQIGNPPV